jgi:peroxiredoxin
MNAQGKGILILAAALLFACAGTEPQIPQPPQQEEPGRLESLAIPMPKPSSEADAAYLGLSGSARSFRMDEIKARVLVVEVFDMYCRFCQGAAPRVDEVYELNLRSGFGDQIKMIGIGRMNTELEVATFKDKYNVRFPLFPDKDLAITRALGAYDDGTPHFMVIKMEPGNRVQVVHTTTGAFEDPKAFYDAVLESSGLRKD